MSSESFQDLPDRLTAGDEDAALDVWERFTARLVALARARLDSRVQQRVAPDDIVQSVYRSFFRGQQEGAFELDSWDSLWALLSMITVRKCARAANAQRAARRDIRRELVNSEDESQSGVATELPTREPSPEEVVCLTDLLSHLFEPLPADKRQMLLLRLQGHKVSEISTIVGRAERSVHRLLQRIRTEVEELAQECEQV
ncbi:ECF-type sigma factor [Aeoliella sp.]|uniref:ECF-type sigma factor n=1 Tax=Aeoliella sp. TaxID=2795800 RepID=UPI003CCBCBEC